MQTIVCFSGKKQSGKNVSGSFLAGSWLKRNNYISDFSINKNGLLKFRMNGWEATVTEKLYHGFNDYFSHLPIKMYSFADSLKSFCINVLGLTYEQCYGDNKQKNSLTHLKWENMPTINGTELRVKNDKNPYMTAREVLQYMGTDIIREMYSDAWVLGTINKIKQDKVKLAIITDGRFPNEIEGIKNVGGYTIRLLRNVFSEDEHESEKALDDYPLDQYSFVLDNRKINVEQQCKEMESFTNQILDGVKNV